MQYKSFTLDPFQQEAIAAIEKNHSVVVSAATGTGKTLIADYIVNKAVNDGKRAIYTAPIKALSNQKFREFKEAYGDKVGLLTGDIVINADAPILIMTTEIYRNMLLEKSRDIEHVTYVIFDEIHFINDRERGTVWEESIIFSPDDVRFLCLSATIPNYQQFASWIASIKNHPVDTVHYMKRAVPLSHQFYDEKMGLTDIDSLIKETKRYRRSRNKFPLANHRQVIDQLEEEDKLPAIFFSFSRKLCEQRAQELAKKHNYTNAAQKKQILQIFNDTVPATVKQLHSSQQLKHILLKGIGIHHAGMLPKQKECVELLFDKHLLQILYATETFAVGINMPARSVIFGSLEKYDGINFRLVNSKEYFQLAGRAGRRGIDEKGYSVVMVDRNHAQDFPKIKWLTQKDDEPIISHYNLSYNTVLNLIRDFNQAQINQILQSNFGYYVKQQSRQQFQITQSFANYKTILTKMGYVEDNVLTWKGDFATRIYANELLITELVYSGILADMTDTQFAITIAAVMYEPKRNDHFSIKNADIGPLLNKLYENSYVKKRIKRMRLKRMTKIVSDWLKGKEFVDLTEHCNLAEGDIIRLFRQLIDMLRQIKGALLATEKTSPLIERINVLLEKIDRDIIKVEL